MIFEIGMRQELLLRLVARWVVCTLAIYIVAWLLPGIMADDFATVIWAGLALGLLNAVLRPLLVLFTLPVTVLTLGLFLLVINAFILHLVGALVPGIAIAHFGWAVLGAFLISVISSVLYAVLGPSRRRIHIEFRR